MADDGLAHQQRPDRRPQIDVACGHRLVDSASVTSKSSAGFMVAKISMASSLGRSPLADRAIGAAVGAGHDGILRTPCPSSSVKA